MTIARCPNFLFAFSFDSRTPRWRAVERFYKIALSFTSIKNQNQDY